MLNELKKQERAWGEFLRWIKEYYGLSVNRGDLFEWLDEYLCNDIMSNAIIHFLCLFFLDEVGIYVTINWLIHDNYKGQFEANIYLMNDDMNPVFTTEFFDSRPSAEEAGIIRAFQIREEQLKGMS